VQSVSITLCWKPFGTIKPKKGETQKHRRLQNKENQGNKSLTWERKYDKVTEL